MNGDFVISPRNFCNHACTVRANDGGWRCGCGLTWRRRGPDGVRQVDELNKLFRDVNSDKECP